METWSFKTIGEIASLGSGSTPPRAQHERYFQNGKNRWVKTGDLNNELASPGGAGRNRTLSQTEFLKTPIPLPCIDEQRRIVEFVNVIDIEIETLQKQLAALKEQKKGLMQKLLTGEVRIKGEL